MLRAASQAMRSAVGLSFEIIKVLQKHHSCSRKSATRAATQLGSTSSPRPPREAPMSCDPRADCGTHLIASLAARCIGCFVPNFFARQCRDGRGAALVASRLHQFKNDGYLAAYVVPW